MIDLPSDSAVAQVRTPPDAVFLGFARALRAGGLPVTADRERVFLEAVVTTGAEKRANVYWSGRATLTSSPADIERYDSVFTAWFSGEPLTAGGRPSDPLSVTRQPMDERKTVVPLMPFRTWTFDGTGWVFRRPRRL